jgi:sugar lactone lactonase YvrE
MRLPVSSPLTVSTSGDVYFNSGNSVMKVDGTGTVTRIAGTGRYGHSDDGGPAASAPLSWPAGLAIDGSGNLFIAENAAQRIRKVSPQGIITTVAGTGVAGYSGDGGPAINAQVNWPTGLALDSAGNLFIADAANHAVRKVSSTGVISTVATDLGSLDAIAVDTTGNLYIADYTVTHPEDDGDDVYSGRILRTTPAGTTDTIFANGPGFPQLAKPATIAVDSAGIIYVVDALKPSTPLKFSGAGLDPVNATPTFGGLAAGVAVDTAGNLYLSESGRGGISRINPQGVITNLLGGSDPGNYWGDGGKATDAGLNVPVGVAIDKAGNLYIADSSNSRVRKVTPDGSISTFAGTGKSGHSGDGGPATAAQLKEPEGLAVDSAGNLYIADRLDCRIRKVSPDGIITTVAGRGDTYPPLGDGGLAINAALAAPLGVAVDSNGNLYIADTSFFLIRKVTPDGIITTLAGRDYYLPNGALDIGFPTGIAVDGAGNVYMATLNTIRKLSSGGTVTTIAGIGSSNVSAGDGGPATSASLHGPFAVAQDSAGNIYISGGDISGYPISGAGYVRKIAPTGVITTIAGNGTIGYSGDGGPATAASFSLSTAGIAVDPTGTIYVSDVYNNAIRVLRPLGQ